MPESNEWCCLSCGKPFQPSRHQRRRRKDGFCSRRCSNVAHFLRPLADRFWEKVSKQEGCWLWVGSRCPHRRRPTIWHPGLKKVTFASRVSWELHFGPIPAGMHVLHHCDNGWCVNPAHLFLGTHQDNMADRRAKGREARGSTLPRTRLTVQIVREIRTRHAAGGITQRALADEFGITENHVSHIVTHRRWKYVL